MTVVEDDDKSKKNIENRRAYSIMTFCVKCVNLCFGLHVYSIFWALPATKNTPKA